MAAEVLAPVDEVTGIPYVLIPHIRGRTDVNHAFFPAADVRIRGLAGQALRNCRSQIVDYDVHHDGFHGEFWGTPLPDTPEKEVTTVTLAAAGVIPEFALDYANLPRSNKSRIVRLDERMRWRMWQTKNVRVQSHELVKRYLLDVVVHQDNFTDVKDTVIDEFLFTEDRARKLELAKSLLGSAISTVASGIEPVYRQAWQSRLMPPHHTAKPSRFIFRALTPQDTGSRAFPYQVNHLQQRLASALAA